MARFTGAQKAAMVFLTLGEEAAAVIAKNLTTEELEAIGMEMSVLAGVKKETSDDLILEFANEIRQEGDINVPGEEFFRKLLPNAVGGAQADDVFAKIQHAKEKIPFKNVREIDPRILAGFIKHEHPQTIAIVLVHLGQEKSSAVLNMLPESLQFEVINRIANLEMVPPELVRDVDEVLEQELLSLSSEANTILGGIPKVAEILNYCDRRTGDNILQAMEDFDADLADKVRKLMFVFEDLSGINDQGIRELLKSIKNEDLVLALKTASEDLKNKLFKNLSQRAGQMLLEDLSMLGPVRLSDVEVAQQNILNIARNLEKEGKIMFAGKEGGDTFV